jgi:hypothetical protein
MGPPLAVAPLVFPCPRHHHGTRCPLTLPEWNRTAATPRIPEPAIGRACRYIQSPNCADSMFTLTLATCGGTRDGFANWGTSVNAVTP